MDFRYPLNRIQEIWLSTHKQGRLEDLDARLYPEADKLQKQIQYIGGSGAGLFSCSMLEKCTDELCDLVLNCTTSNSETVWCSQTTCNRLKKIVSELASCLPDCPAVSQEDRDWLGIQEWKWLIWDETNTPTRGLSSMPAPVERKVIVSKGNANTCPPENEQNCVQHFGCDEYDPEVVYADPHSNQDVDIQTDLWSSNAPSINSLNYIDFRATRSKIKRVEVGSNGSIWYFLADRENQLTEMLFIYPVEILGQRNLTGFQIDIHWNGTLDACELQVGSIDLRFADILYRQEVPKDQPVSILVHDKDLSGNINSSASDSYFMFIRLKFTENSDQLPSTRQVVLNALKIYAITTAPPIPEYLDYQTFRKNIQQITDGVYLQAVSFDGTPLRTGLISGTIEFKPSDWDTDDTIPNKDKLYITNSYVDEEGCGTIPPCGCCCKNVRESDCGYCQPFTLPENHKYGDFSNYAITEVPEDGLASPQTDYHFAVPMKLLTFDFSCLSQLD